MSRRQAAWAIFWDEVHYLSAGRFPLALILVGVPLLFTILFGVVYQENVIDHVPLVVCDGDQSSMSRQLIQMYADSDRFDVIAVTDTEERARQSLSSDQARAALVIPHDFSKDIKVGNAANLLLMVSSSNNMFANAALAASSEIARTYTVGIAQKMMQGVGFLPDEAMSAAYPVRLGVRILGNPTNGYSSFMLSGLMLNGLQIGIMLTITPLLVRERRRYSNTDAAWLSLAVRPIPHWLFAMAGYLISLIAVVCIFAVPMQGRWWEAVLLGGTFCFFVCGVLLLFSSLAKNDVFAIQMPMLYIMPGLLYSGLSWPEFDMNQYAEVFGALLPMTYSADVLRDILLMGDAPQLCRSNLVMMLSGGLCSILAWAIFMGRTYMERKGEPTA